MDRVTALWHRWKAPALFLALFTYTLACISPAFFQGMTWEGF